MSGPKASTFCLLLFITVFPGARHAAPPFEVDASGGVSVAVTTKSADGVTRYLSPNERDKKQRGVAARGGKQPDTRPKQEECSVKAAAAAVVCEGGFRLCWEAHGAACIAEGERGGISVLLFLNVSVFVSYEAPRFTSFDTNADMKRKNHGDPPACSARGLGVGSARGPDWLRGSWGR
jgi:hypothetical protein